MKSQCFAHLYIYIYLDSYMGSVGCVVGCVLATTSVGPVTHTIAKVQIRMSITAKHVGNGGIAQYANSV